MKLLVTGGAGFIGSNFIRCFLKRHEDCSVINLDKLTYAGNLDNLKGVEKDPRYRFVRGDIADAALVDRIMGDGVDTVINFAAETHVDRSIGDSTDFIKTDVYGAYVLLENAKKHMINKFVQISCYDDKTRALTPDGLKTYTELKKGDIVFSLNPETRKVELKPVEKVIIQKYKGRMIHLNNKRIDLLVTPNHNMFILGKNKSKLIVERADEVAERSIFYMPKGCWKGKKDDYFDIQGYGRVATKDLMYLLGIFIGDGFTAYQEKRVETRTGLAREEYFGKSKNGSTGRFKKIEKQGDHITTCHSYRIFLDVPENDRCRKRVEEVLSRIGVKWHCHKGKAGSHLYFSSKPLMEFFARCGMGAHNKHIPRWALEYSPEYLRFLFDGLMDSDGRNNKIYHTVSRRLVSDMCELCIKMSLEPSIHKRHTISHIGGRKVEGDAYYVFVARTAKSISRHRIKLVDYEGDVWCLKVKDNKNFLVERNGRFDFCGNTDEVYGSIEKGSFTEESPLMPRNPYSASKAGADRLAYSFWATYRTPVIITRASNNFGPYQYPEKVIPLFVTNALRDIPLPLYGDGMNIRDWLYVEDHCGAIDFLLEKGECGEVYNIGGGNELANLDLTNFILDYLKKPRTLLKYVKDRQGHDRRYSLDCRKIRKLGWKPRSDFRRAIGETIDWYVKNEWWWDKLKSGEYWEYYRKQYVEREKQ